MTGLRSLLHRRPLRWVMRARHEYHVRRTKNWMFWGSFDSHEAAVAGAPRRKDMAIGYATPGMAAVGRSGYEQMYPFDYPALYWLDRFIRELKDKPSISVVDLGGHLGEKHRVYGRYVDFPSTLRWTVCDTEDAVQEASRQGLASPALRFTADSSAVDRADILLAFGSLQYMEDSLGALLDRLDSPPARIIMNKVPLSSGPETWTLQNVGRAMVVYHVFNRERFMAEMSERGYTLHDHWQVPEREVSIPFRDHVGTDSNAGLVWIK